MERYDFRTQRLFMEPELREGGKLTADRGQANYLLNVLRLKDDSEILLFNGRDGEWLARVEPKGRKACDIHLVRRIRPQPTPYDLIYCFAPLKQARLDYMVQKAVEMGAGVLQPVQTQHSQVSKLNIERMQANAVEAAEQCGILSIPQCREMVKLDALLANWDRDRVLVFADEAAQDTSPLNILSKTKGKRLALLIGPEGGFSKEERERLLNEDFVLPISLGPRILRADTAAVAALAVIQASTGDWDG